MNRIAPTSGDLAADHRAWRDADHPDYDGQSMNLAVQAVRRTDPWDGVPDNDRTYIEAAYAGRPASEITADVDYYTAENAAYTPPAADAPWAVRAAQQMVAEDLELGLRAARTALRLRRDGHLP